MELNKAIGVKYPTKTDINLAVNDKQRRDHKKLLPVAIFLVVFIGLFCKLAVIDLLHRVDAAQAQAQAAADDVDRMKAQNKIYDDVLQQYNEMVSLNLNSSVVATLEERLDMVNTYLISAARVESFHVMDDVITAGITGVTLHQVSEIYTSLMQNAYIANVQIYTASTNGEPGALTRANMTIILETDKARVAEKLRERGDGQS